VLSEVDAGWDGVEVEEDVVLAERDDERVPEATGDRARVGTSIRDEDLLCVPGRCSHATDLATWW
jgi:hypothetical protein